MQKWKVGNTPVSYKASFPLFFSVVYEENFENLLSQARKSRNLLEFYFTMTPREKEEIINLPLFPTVWFWVLLTHKHTDINLKSLKNASTPKLTCLCLGWNHWAINLGWIQGLWPALINSRNSSTLLDLNHRDLIFF